MVHGLLLIGSAVTTYLTCFKLINSKKNNSSNRSSRVASDHPTSLIIGTGIIGLTSAYYLAKSGHKVICIEKREDVAMETSYKNGSLICPSLLTPWANSDVPKKFLKSFFTTSSGVPGTKIWPSTFLSPTFYRWIYEYLKNCTPKAEMRNAAHLLTLSMYSRQCLDDILHEVPISFSRCAEGSLQVAADSDILQQLANDSKHIPHVQLLSSADQVVQHEPILGNVKNQLYGGVYSRLDTNGNIHEFCCALKKYLIENYGVQFVFNEEIKNFLVTKRSDDHRDDRRQYVHGVITMENKVIKDIDNIILTNGNYIMPLMKKLNVYMPIYPVKGYVVEIKTPLDIPLPKMNIVDDINKLYISALKPTESYNTVRVSGLAEFAGWRDIGIVSEPNRAEYLYQQTLYWLPHLAPYEKSFHSCSRPVSPDDLPIIGRCYDFDNLFVNCGHGSKGWTLAFGSAALLADLVNEISSTPKAQHLDPEAYSPNRFT